MSKLNKLREILKIGTAIGKPFAPGAVGSVLDIVNQGLADKSDPANEKSFKTLAEVNDQQTQAILVLDARIRKLEGK